MMRTLSLLTLLIAFVTGEALAENGQKTGRYDYGAWRVGALAVEYAMPEPFRAETPILIVIPGARRNAGDYRDQWKDLARQFGFAVVTLECSRAVCPTEYEYNLGNVMTEAGVPNPRSKWLFSAIDPVFEDFKARFGATAEQYALYGHSAGGGFVHRFMAFMPDAKVSRAVSANAAFFTMPDSIEAFPFGLTGSTLDDAAVKTWLGQPLTIMLGDQDLGPRTKPLSNGPKARAQGPNVFSRGLRFHAAGVSEAIRLGAEFKWTLDVVHKVGHSNTKMAPHAVEFLFDPAELKSPSE